jgi:transposase
MSKKKANRIPVTNTTAVGIDIGSRFHVVAVPTALCDDPVKRFQAFTTDLHNRVAWLV